MVIKLKFFSIGLEIFCSHCSHGDNGTSEASLSVVMNFCCDQDMHLGIININNTIHGIHHKFREIVIVNTLSHKPSFEQIANVLANLDDTKPTMDVASWTHHVKGELEEDMRIALEERLTDVATCPQG